MRSTKGIMNNSNNNSATSSRSTSTSKAPRKSTSTTYTFRATRSSAFALQIQIGIMFLVLSGRIVSSSHRHANHHHHHRHHHATRFMSTPRGGPCLLNRSSRCQSRNVTLPSTSSSSSSSIHIPTSRRRPSSSSTSFSSCAFLHPYFHLRSHSRSRQHSRHFSYGIGDQEDLDFQFDDDESIFNEIIGDETEKKVNNRMSSQNQSRLSSIYNDMFENDDNNNDNNDTKGAIGNIHTDVNVNENTSKSTKLVSPVAGGGYYNQEENEEEYYQSTLQNDDYIDYITSQSQQQMVQGDKSSSNTDSNSNSNQNHYPQNENTNDNNDSMIDDLFQNDFPSTLPMTQRDLDETAYIVKSNHNRYSSQYGPSSSSTMRNTRNTPTSTTSLSPVIPSTSIPPPPKAARASSSPVKLPNSFQSPPKASPPPPPPADPPISTPTLPPPVPAPVAPLKMSKITTTEKEVLQFTMNQIQSQIYKENNDVQFNIKSYKQVSNVLFGVDDESTSREVLEALTGNLVSTGLLSSSASGSDSMSSADSIAGKKNKNIPLLAKLILEYRKLNSKLKRLDREEKNKLNGSHVRDASQLFADGASTGGTNRASASNVVPDELRINDGDRTRGNNSNDSNIIEPLVLIDASAYIFRAYYSMPPIHRFDGEPTGATLGFCNMLNKLVLKSSFLQVQQEQGQAQGATGTVLLPPRVVLVFDSKDGINFRKKMYPEYKANRKPCPIDLIPQFDFVRDAADAYGILQLEAAGYEADDIIATIATKALEEGCFVNILSGDKDLMQLVTQGKGGEDHGYSSSNDDDDDDDNGGSGQVPQPRIELIDPMNMVRVGYDGVIEKWGVEPEKLGDVLALAGDSADNIPGVPGIGPKIAASLIQEYGSLDGVLQNVDHIKQKARREKLKENTEMALLSRKLVELERNVPMEAMLIPSKYKAVSDFRMTEFNQDRLFQFYDRMGFRDLKKRVKSQINLGQKTQENAEPMSSKISDKYSSILENQPTRTKEGGRSASEKFTENTKPMSSIINDKYSSILENQPTRTKGGGRSASEKFTKKTKYISPPEQSDFDDVPF